MEDVTLQEDRGSLTGVLRSPAVAEFIVWMSRLSTGSPLGRLITLERVSRSEGGTADEAREPAGLCTGPLFSPGAGSGGLGGAHQAAV